MLTLAFDSRPFHPSSQPESRRILEISDRTSRSCIDWHFNCSLIAILDAQMCMSSDGHMHCWRCRLAAPSTRSFYMRSAAINTSFPNGTKPLRGMAGTAFTLSTHVFGQDSNERGRRPIRWPSQEPSSSVCSVRRPALTALLLPSRWIPGQLSYLRRMSRAPKCWSTCRKSLGKSSAAVLWRFVRRRRMVFLRRLELSSTSSSVL